ncbi:uncharacterized protein LOC111444270 [Cucurbita moschata]|uniref:Uncharacterized protein LOC111444270 n=1 Tax=Cucurbita moschata TaxID=3662 RepID=A0A6J1FCZ9_CUCMO|nr:uncharacterized protein LOC111444270 [Cucurbita moschata]
MDKKEATGSPGWGASLFLQTTEDVATDEGGSPLQRLQRQVNKVLQGFSSPPQLKTPGTYNPELLTTQKRQWANFQLHYLDHRSQKEPSRIFESMVVVGLHPNCDIQALQEQYVARKSEAHIEPQVLFVYPPEKQLPLKDKDLLSFCFPGGVEVHAVEKTPSMSKLNEILLGQEHFKQSDLSFVFRLQVADDSTLYGCCVLVEELVQKPSGLLSVSEKALSYSSLSRYVLTTRRCYCILSRLPFFELHFGVLNSILTEERLERLTKGIGVLNLESTENLSIEEDLVEDIGCMTLDQNAAEDMSEGKEEDSQRTMGDENHLDHQISRGISEDIDVVHKETRDVNVDDFTRNKQATDRRLPNAVLPLLRYYQYESSESSSSFQGSPSEDRNFRSDADDTETEEASFSGQDDSTDLLDILERAKKNKKGSLQIICEYYELHYPGRGCSVKFHPLEHLHAMEYHRSGETVLHVAGSTIDPRSCSTSLELAEAQGALMVEEEANALSIWTVASICGSLRLDHILSILAGALLEKQIVIVCSNLGILSASVLSIIPMIRPYQWQSLLMPVLPNDMLDFLDAPVPYIVGVKSRTSEVQSKLTNAILVDVNKNQVKAPTIPELPKQKELFASLRRYHAELVGESYLGRKRPVHECTDVQVEAAKGFLKVLRLYLDSLCSNLRSHTITNVQSNDDKVSLLLKESFVESFPSHDRPFLKVFVETQFFSVHTDLVLSFFQKE